MTAARGWSTAVVGTTVLLAAFLFVAEMPTWRLALGLVALALLNAGWFVFGFPKATDPHGSIPFVIVTIVAVGTSLPELVTSVVAARKGQPEVAFGNVVGSNIYNLLGIGGATMLMAPGAVPAGLLPFDIGLVVASAVAILFLTAARGVSRLPAFALLAAYAGYLGFLVLTA